MPASAPLRLAVSAVSLADNDSAAALAEALSLALVPPVIDPVVAEGPFDALLLVSGQRISLQQTGKQAPGPVTVDFDSGSLRYRRQSGHNELLGKAVGVGKKTALHVLDATAGLGRDAYVLADLGCYVLLCERNPVVAALLDSGLRAIAASDDHALARTAARMQLHAGDACQLAAETVDACDVIYLDPMFPARQKSAAVKKEMALFQRLLHNAADEVQEEALLHWALQAKAARVVVKRPLRAAPLAGREPGHSIRGKAVRYDVYVRRKLV